MLMRGPDTRNPCTKLCDFDRHDVCRGCRRTKAEAKRWKRLTDPEKAAINARLAATAPLPDATAARKRQRKLDRKIRKLEAKLAALRAEREGLAAPSAPRGQMVVPPVA